MFSTLHTASHAVINQGGWGHCVELLLLLPFVTRFKPIRLHMSRQNNNRQKRDTVEAHKVKLCKIALTEPEGKTVILRSPSNQPLLFPHCGLSAWRGNYITQTSSQLWWIPSPEKTGQPDLHLRKIRSSDYNASYLPPLDKSSMGAQKQSPPVPLQLII